MEEASLFVPPFGTCNWRELSGFIKLVIQMSNRKRQLQADLGVTEGRNVLSLAQG
jgi:hypothetical protein